MNNKKNLFKLLGASIMLVALGSCGSGIPSGGNENNNGMEQPDVNVSGPSIPTTNGNQKVIYQVDYTIYDDNFHKAASEISAKAVEYNGFVLTSTEDFNYGTYKFKIPTENLNLFVSFVDTYNVGNKSIQTKDVTESFDSVQYKIDELEKEKTTLKQLLEDDTLEQNVIDAYKARIQEIDGQLSKLKSQKTEQDKIVNYSTVVINFYESKKTENDIYWDNYFHYMKVVGKGVGTVLLYSAPFAVVSGLAIGVAYFLVKKKEK